MARSGAERQAAYRARQSEASNQRRISTWISSEAALALEVLARRYGVTMREVIEVLLLKECENFDKSMINKEIILEKASSKRSLRGNTPAKRAPKDIGAPEGSLLRNVEPGPAAGLKYPQQVDGVAVPPRGEQFSLEL